MPPVRVETSGQSSYLGRAGRAALRRLAPRSRFGDPWIVRDDGTVTFRERGFVAAPSAAMLLARHNFEVARIAEELSSVRVARSLEIGCGFGRLSPWFARHSDEHHAVDLNESALDVARRRTRTRGSDQALVQDLPFPDGHFGLVSTWTVLQHVRPEHIEAACAEIVRVLNADGVLLLCEETRLPNAGAAHTWHRTAETYVDLFARLTLKRRGMIAEIARLPGMDSPGEVFLFERTAA